MLYTERIGALQKFRKFFKESTRSPTQHKVIFNFFKICFLGWSCWNGSSEMVGSFQMEIRPIRNPVCVTHFKLDWKWINISSAPIRRFLRSVYVVGWPLPARPSAESDTKVQRSASGSQKMGFSHCRRFMCLTEQHSDYCRNLFNCSPFSLLKNSWQGINGLVPSSISPSPFPFFTKHFPYTCWHPWGISSFSLCHTEY